MGEKPQNIKHRHISLGVLAHVDAGKRHYRKACFLNAEGSGKSEESITRMRIWIPMSLRGREESPFFKAGSFFHGGYGSDTSGYAGACGFFC